MSLTTAAAIAGGVSALASAIGGTILSGQENNAGKKVLKRLNRTNDKWHAVDEAKDLMTRPDEQARLKAMRDMLDERYGYAQRTNVVAGGTPEALALQQQAANNATAQAASEMAANIAREKLARENQYRANHIALQQQDAQMHQQQAAAIAQAAGQGVDAGLDLMGNSIANIKKKA